MVLNAVVVLTLLSNTPVGHDTLYQPDSLKLPISPIPELVPLSADPVNNPLKLGKVVSVPSHAATTATSLQFLLLPLLLYANRKLFAAVPQLAQVNPFMVLVVGLLPLLAVALYPLPLRSLT